MPKKKHILSSRKTPNMYEFQFGKKPMDPEGPRYVLPSAFDRDDDNSPAGSS